MAFLSQTMTHNSRHLVTVNKHKVLSGPGQKPEGSQDSHFHDVGAKKYKSGLDCGREMLA